MTEPRYTIGRQIKFHREAHCLSQKDLAEQVDVSPATISGTENGRFIPSPEILHRLARTLQIPFHELVELLPDPQTDTLIDIVQIYSSRREFDKALELVSKLKQDDTLLEYQRDEVTYHLGSLLVRQQESMQHGLEILYALATQGTRSNQIDPLLVAKSHKAIGNVWYIKQDFVTARHHYQRVLEIIQGHPEPNSHLLAGIYYNIGACLRNFRAEELAIDYLQKALLLMKELQLPYYVASCYYYIGICYSHLRDFQNAGDYYRKSIPYFYEAGDVGFAVQAHSLSYFHGTASSEETLLILEDELRNPNLPNFYIAVLHIRIAKVYLDLKDYENAKTRLDHAYKLTNEFETQEPRAYLLLIYARYMMEVGNYEAASTFAFDASELYAFLRCFNFDFQDSLQLGRDALQRLRASFEQ